MRRIPFIYVKENKVQYVCPCCKHIIPRDLYKLNELCPTCGNYINRYAKTIKKVYKIVDEEFYKYFI